MTGLGIAFVGSTMLLTLRGQILGYAIFGIAVIAAFLLGRWAGRPSRTRHDPADLTDVHDLFEPDGDSDVVLPSMGEFETWASLDADPACVPDRERLDGGAA